MTRLVFFVVLANGHQLARASLTEAERAVDKCHALGFSAHIRVGRAS